MNEYFRIMYYIVYSRKRLAAPPAHKGTQKCLVERGGPPSLYYFWSSIAMQEIVESDEMKAIDE